MTFDTFTALLRDPSPPALAPLLQALWHDYKGDWERAHRIAQDIDTRDGAHVHAYLHRKEGDPANAGYWYRRAGVAPASCALEEEWKALVTLLLDHPLA